MTTTTRDVGHHLEKRLREKGRDAVMTYGQLRDVFDDLPEFTAAWNTHPLCRMFEELDLEDAALGRPFRTAAVISKDDGVPGPGFFKMYARHRDPEARVRNDLDRIEVHQKELKAVAAFYGHPSP